MLDSITLISVRSPSPSAQTVKNNRDTVFVYARYLFSYDKNVIFSTGVQSKNVENLKNLVSVRQFPPQPAGVDFGQISANLGLGLTFVSISQPENRPF